MSIWLITFLGYLGWLIVSRTFAIYINYKFLGKTRDNPYYDSDLVALIWVPFIGDFVFLTETASKLGETAYLNRQKSLILQQQLRDNLKVELHKNKDLLIAAIQEVEQLKT